MKNEEIKKLGKRLQDAIVKYNELAEKRFPVYFIDEWSSIQAIKSWKELDKIIDSRKRVERLRRKFDQVAIECYL